jgi:hypothetical protein
LPSSLAASAMSPSTKTTSQIPIPTLTTLSLTAPRSPRAALAAPRRRPAACPVPRVPAPANATASPAPGSASSSTAVVLAAALIRTAPQSPRPRFLKRLAPPVVMVSSSVARQSRQWETGNERMNGPEMPEFSTPALALIWNGAKSATRRKEKILTAHIHNWFSSVEPEDGHVRLVLDRPAPCFDWVPARTNLSFFSFPTRPALFFASTVLFFPRQPDLRSRPTTQNVPNIREGRRPCGPWKGEGDPLWRCVTAGDLCSFLCCRGVCVNWKWWWWK